VIQPQAEGFGSKLIELSVVRQLGGSIERDWAPEGLKVEIRIPTPAIHRPA
jgi:two-component sensor histidine kinase